MLDKIKETTDFIFAKPGAKPDYGIVLGSGLGIFMGLFLGVLDR